MSLHPAKSFPADFESAVDRLEHLDLSQYQATRNDLDGAVSALSPYLTHGVFSLVQVRDAVLRRYPAREIQKFLDELLWREFFHRVWQARGDDVLADLREPQLTADRDGVPEAILESQTGIHVLDDSVRALLETGYVHNHARMWIAAVACHVGRCHWSMPARWMYSHLLDGDIASNWLSWQWVAGSFSSKPYVADQENLNRFSKSRQTGTFLDRPRDQLIEMPVPDVLKTLAAPFDETSLSESARITVHSGERVLLYHPWHLNPCWRADEDWRRILVLEPSHFRRFPVSDRRIKFLAQLAQNIAGLEVFVGEIGALSGLDEARGICSVEYPATVHWPGERDQRDWLYPETCGYFRSFSAFRKACLKKRKAKPFTS